MLNHYIYLSILIERFKYKNYNFFKKIHNEMSFIFEIM
jgi:hypothetical protein